MAPATEIAYITLKPGIEDFEGESPEAKAWQESVSQVSAREGFQRCYYGRQIEDPSMLIFVIDWESRDAHVKFMNDPSYGPFKARLTSLMEGVHLHHITQPKTALLGLAPVMEVATFYDAEPTMLQNVEKFAAALEKGNPEGFHGVVYGKVMEKIVRHAGVGKEDAKPGEAVVLLIGWDSKEIHLAFRETELFKENIGLLREKNSGAELFHVPFKTV